MKLHTQHLNALIRGPVVSPSDATAATICPVRLRRAVLNLAGLALASTLALVSVSAMAQTAAPAAAKPANKVAPKPAAAAPAASAESDKGLAKGSGTSRQPILTRDELRTCFAQEETIRKRLEALEAERIALNKEKETISVDQKALQVERAPLNDVKRQAEEFAARLKLYSARVESWNQRVAAHNDEKKGGAQAEKDRLELNKEREDIGKEGTVLEAEKARINTANEQAVAAFNTKAGALDVRVKSWNERNSKVNDTGTDVEFERKQWVSTCSDRRYREEDEAAIKAGK